jgi:trehalose 6-phosphate phosphatase
LANLNIAGQGTGPYELATDEAAWVKKLVFENKGVAASIHYRLCPDPELARRVVLEQTTELARRSGLRVGEGRMAIELKPPVGANKGTALAELVESYKLKSLILMGDDLADVEGFRALKRKERESLVPHSHSNFAAPVFKSLAVGVSSTEMPAAVNEWADVIVDGVGGVEQFLSWLSAALTYQLATSPYQDLSYEGLA